LKEAQIAARRAGQILKENINTAAKISFKGAVDLVTDFDHQAQNLIFDQEWKKEIVLGIVYDPMREEMFSAVKDQGAFLNGQRIKVSAVDSLDKSLLATGFPYDLRESKINNISHFNNFLLRVQAIRRCGSAAMVFCLGFRLFAAVALQLWIFAM